LDKAIQYDWHLQRIHMNIDKEEWVSFWRRYNLLQFFSNTASTEVVADTMEIDRDEVKMYYPGLEDIVDILLDNNIRFSLEGDVDLTDADGIVLASAGMLIRESMVAIDPIDNNSTAIFESAGYTILYSNNFNINDIKNK
jgi:DEAD/DEAH box helicase domain-containing protein